MDVSTSAILDTNGKRRINKRWPVALKQEIVAASFAPGASVSTVARQYDVNANQVFSWRRRYGPALAAVARPVPPEPRPRLVPVTIAAEPEGVAAPPGVSGGCDTITIAVAGTDLVHVGANFEAHALRRVLDCLGRAGGAREKNR